MSAQSRRIFLWGIPVFPVLGMLYALSSVQYFPDEAVGTARSFIGFVAAGKYQDAFALTRKRETGKTLPDFITRAERQFGKPVPENLRIEMARPVLPSQSYGNRVRRWLIGRPADPATLSCDFVLRGEKLFLPFEVRLDRTDEGWRVSYFQSHAG